MSRATRAAACSTSSPKTRWGLLSRLGPGLITGASDDDPSGIATYSQAGAAFGYGLLWTMPVALPLMAAIQEISARIGRITGHGIARNIRQHYPGWVLYPIIITLVITNIVNIGADIGAMGDAVRLLVGGPALAYSIAFAVITILLQVYGNYSKCCGVFKFLALALISYVITGMLSHIQWKSALKMTVVPHFEMSSDYWATFVAVLGTTISPYLFFWQAVQETEEIKSKPDEEALKKAPEQAREQFGRIRFDTYVGMTLSNVIAYFIITAAAATLHKNGVTQIETSAEAAGALKPLAGNAAFLLFTLGIVGTGLLAVPVLSGSAAYAMGEAFRWKVGINKKPRAARGFYAVIILATLIGLAINFPAVQHVTHLTPIRALFWAAVLNGIAAVPIMVLIMLMASNNKVVGKFGRISKTLRAIGWTATAIMAIAAVLMLVTLKK